MKVIQPHLDKYLKLTEKALGKIKLTKKLSDEMKAAAHDFLDLSRMYFNDAKYFKEKGDLITAFAAVNYAHAFLDAGVRLRVFAVTDTKLFMVD